MAKPVVVEIQEESDIDEHELPVIKFERTVKDAEVGNASWGMYLLASYIYHFLLQTTDIAETSSTAPQEVVREEETPFE